MSINHFLLIKQADHDAEGARLTAIEAAKKLLDAGMWPLWQRTPCKDMVKAGDKIAIYLAGPGNQVVMAKAVVHEKVDWIPAMKREYPLTMSGVPLKVLRLSEIEILPKPISVLAHITTLNFIGQNRQKWGVRLMGGMRCIDAADFKTLTCNSGFSETEHG